MGLFRKVASISSLGAVDFKSDKERIATYTKQTRNELRKLNQQTESEALPADAPWVPGRIFMTSSDASANLDLLLSQRRFEDYKGYGGFVSIESDGLTIGRKGAVSRLQNAPQGEMRIDFLNVKGVVNRDPNLATNGYIILITPAGSGPETRVLFTNQHKKEYAELLQILRAAAEVNYWTLMEKGQAAALELQAKQSLDADIASRLEVITDLLDKGLISESEFNEKRSEILGTL